MSDEKAEGAGADELAVNEETLKDMDLTEESEAEDVEGGTVMCATIGNCSTRVEL